MQIGNVIRKYRKEKNITQEEMAHRLGVTPPAVNKWENGNSYPDITLLAPLARLLDTNVDTLLSFREELTMEEINQFIHEVSDKLKKELYEEVFQWAKKKIEQYPNCDTLILYFMQTLDGWRLTMNVSNAKAYDEDIIAYYKRVLESADEALRTSAAASLSGLYLREEQYEEAERYLAYFSDQNPEKKRRQAEIYSKTGRIAEAYKAYEQLLFSECQRATMIFSSIYMLAVQEKDVEKARLMAEKQIALAKLFEMGSYQEIVPMLDLAKLEEDDGKVQEIGKKLIEEIESIGDSRKSPLYEHMEFKELSSEFIQEMKKNLQESFQENR